MNTPGEEGGRVSAPELTATRFAEASHLTKVQISRLAEECAERLAYEPGDDLTVLISKLGGQVIVQDTLTQDPERSGSLFVRGRNDFAIVVPVHTSILRDKFTIAHELGHYVVHYLGTINSESEIHGPMVALRKGSERVEWEANWFAAAFLMPEEKFKSEFLASNGDLLILSKKFSVSSRACEIRSRQLELV